MKKITAFLLAVVFLLTGCASQKKETEKEIEPVNVPDTQSVQKIETTQTKEESESETEAETKPSFTTLSDPALCTYMQDSLSETLTQTLDAEQYKIENIETVYYSKEFLDELEYNSKENIYFGYSLSELEEQFEGEKYVFTLGEDGQTTVEPFEGYDNSKEKQLIKNVAIGAGVILICVTVVYFSPQIAGAGTVAKTTQTLLAISSTAAKDLIQDASMDFIGNVVKHTVNSITNPDEKLNLEKTLKKSAIETKKELPKMAVTAIGGALKK